MTTSTRSPQFYAKLAGTIYIGAMALSMFTQVYVPGQIIADGAAATASNLTQHESLYRSSLVIDLFIFVTDVVIAWAFYELLRSVDSGLARLGAFLRIADAAILSASTICGLAALKLISGVDYLASIPTPQLDALARAFLNLRGTGLYVGFVFLGAGSAAFAWVLYKSRYVPRLLSGWGVFASLLLALGSLATLYSPWFAANLSMIFMVPMFFYEVPLGLWFLIKGVKLPEG